MGTPLSYLPVESRPEPVAACIGQRERCYVALIVIRGKARARADVDEVIVEK